MIPHKYAVDFVLDKFVEKKLDLMQKATFAFLPDLEFYSTAVNYEKKLDEHSEETCHPSFSDDETKMLNVHHPYKLLTKENSISNDYFSNNNERIYLITGANNGGKTFFSKTIGISYLLTQRGLRIFSSGANMKIIDKLYSHFVDQDDPLQGQGRYMFELSRMEAILDECSKNSFIIVDEPCGGTEPEQGRVQSSYFLEAIAEGGLRGIFTTHYHRLAEDSEKISDAILNKHPDTYIDGKEIIYTHKLVSGSAGTSMALELAKSMNLGRDELLKKAKRINGTLKQ